MCAFYEPPSQNLAIFDPDVFNQNDEPLTIESGSKYFLRFPSAQGEENLQTTNVNGVLTANSSTNLNGTLFVSGTSSFEDAINMTSTVANERRIYSSYYNLKDVNGNVNRTSEIYQNSQILTLTNEATNGRTRFINSTSGDVPTTTFEIDTTSVNIYEPLNVANNLTMSSNNSNERQITSSYYNINDINGVIGRSSRMYQDGINLLISNDATSGKTRFSCEDTGGNPINVMEMESFVGTTCYRPLVILANNNFTMNAGTGVISQPTVTNDITTNNQLRRTTIQYNNSGNATANPAMEIYESAGRGFYFIPNVLGGAYGPNTQTGDSAIISRHFAMTTTAMLFATGTSLRNHLRLLANTDLTACSLVLQNGANAIANTSEFRMDYNSTGPTNTMSFNNPINFNPTNNGAINSNRRALTGLGTLSFTDISGNNTTTGSTTSAIWTDSSLVSSLNGMYYDCGINGGFHQFSTRDSAGNVSTPIYYGSAITSVSNTFIIRSSATPSNRFDILTDAGQNTNIRARSTTASTSALININCDEVNAGGTTFNRPVMTIAPTNIEVKRPIQFNYTTTPNAVNQLGFLVGTTMASVNVNANANIRNITTYTFTSAGTYLINWGVYANMNSGTANFTDFEIGIAGTASNTFDSYTQTYTSYKNLIRTYPTLTTTSDLYEPTSCVYVASSGSIAYFNYLANYTGGTNIIIGGYYTITRIG